MRIHPPQQLSFVTLVFALFAPALHAERVVVVAGGGNEATALPAGCRLQVLFVNGFAHSGNFVIVEMAGGERILRVEGRGMLTVFAGTGEKGDSGDGGPAAQAQFNGMHSLAVGPGEDRKSTRLNSRHRQNSYSVLCLKKKTE